MSTSSSRPALGLVRIEYADAPLDRQSALIDPAARRFTIAAGGVALAAEFELEQFAALALAMLIAATEDGVDIDAAIALLPAQQRQTLSRWHRGFFAAGHSGTVQ